MTVDSIVTSTRQWSLYRTLPEQSTLASTTCLPSLLAPPLRSTLEHLFLELALTQPSLKEAEEVAISFDLNVHELYQVVAQTKLDRGDGEGALNIYLHSTVSSHVRGM